MTTPILGYISLQHVIQEGIDKSAHSLTILRERRICTFVWSVSLAAEEEVTKQTLHQDSRQLKLKSEQNQQAAEESMCRIKMMRATYPSMSNKASGRQSSQDNNPLQRKTSVEQVPSITPPCCLTKSRASGASFHRL